MTTVVRHQLFPQKPPGSSLWFSRTGVLPSPGSSTIELPSAFAESGAYPPDRELPGSPRQCSLPLACRHPHEGHQIGARKRRAPGNTIILSQPYRRRVSTDRLNREGSQLLIPRNQVSEGAGTSMVETRSINVKKTTNNNNKQTTTKSMHGEHLCVVALTSMERGTQFFPLATYRFV